MVDKFIVKEFITEMSGIKSLGLKSSGVEMSCNPFKECDLDLDQKDEGDPHNYKPGFLRRPQKFEQNLLVDLNFTL